jgi:UDP-N-acetylmuramyl tripeptide synthase
VGAGLGALSRAAGRGSGSVVGGHAILAIEPKALQRFSVGRQVVLVSGTNGKTTTTKLLAGALAAGAAGEVVTNLTGANLPTGLAAALAAGRPGLPAVLEVDEAWLGSVAAQVRPAALVLLNLSRDQLDRNNEVRHVAQRWRRACEALPPGAVVVANADDPLVAWAARAARSVTWVGAGLSWESDAAGCPDCGGAIIFGAGSPAAGSPAAGSTGAGVGAGTGGTRTAGGGWRCSACGFGRPEPDIWLDPAVPGGSAELASGARHALGLQLPGRCNKANAVTALAAVLALGYAPERPLQAMTTVREVAGRYATLDAAGVRARLLLAKNPAGWAEVFDMLEPVPGPVVVAINARTADGHDPSWLWDVPFELLSGRPVVATGERYLDLAVRLHYADVQHVSEPDLVAALVCAGRLGAGGPGAGSTGQEVAGQEVAGHGKAGMLPVDVVANYTSFHQLLARLRSMADR